MHEISYCDQIHASLRKACDYERVHEICSEPCTMERVVSINCALKNSPLPFNNGLWRQRIISILGCDE